MPTTNIQTNTISESQTPRLIRGATKGIKAQESAIYSSKNANLLLSLHSSSPRKKIPIVIFTAMIAPLR